MPIPSGFMYMDVGTHSSPLTKMRHKIILTNTVATDVFPNSADYDTAVPLTEGTYELWLYVSIVAARKVNSSRIYTLSTPPLPRAHLRTRSHR